VANVLQKNGSIEARLLQGGHARGAELVKIRVVFREGTFLEGEVHEALCSLREDSYI